MIKVIVTQRIDYIEDYNETRESLDRALLEWLIQADCLPIPISNKLMTNLNVQNHQVNENPMLKNLLSAIKPNALLLSGGNDIGSYPERDATEHYLLNWAKDQTIPVLGICRGMQMMGVHAGGMLINVEGHVSKRHHLQLVDKSCKKFPKSVNSYHNQVLKECPNSFEILAKSEDGNIEAMMHKELSWEGWMWHPEREDLFKKEDTERLKQLFSI